MGAVHSPAAALLRKQRSAVLITNLLNCMTNLVAMDDTLEEGQFRLLDVDNRCIIPVDCHIRLIMTGKTSCPY